MGSPEPTEGHIYSAFDSALGALRLKVLEMGGLVVDQVSTAVQALLDGDRLAAETVLEREAQVNDYEQAIERSTVELLARQAPVANDLRVIVAIGRTVVDLERAGDEAKKIARFALATITRPNRDPSATVHRQLRHMAQLSSGMLRRAIDALDRGDATVAFEVARRDRELDEEFEASLRRLVTVAMEGGRLLRPTIDTVFALKSLERIGDHAKNVAEHVVFLVSGETVRHPAAGAAAGNRPGERRSPH
jgi:phosphate transport system protein